jgi:hypothetical protein
MKTLICALLLLSFGATSCSKDGIPAGTPACILDRIEQMKKDPVGNPPQRVWRYTYKGQVVYYIPQQCCDIPSILLNDKCETICAPDGGFAGSGDGKCADFFQTRTEEKLIWQDDRKR